MTKISNAKAITIIFLAIIIFFGVCAYAYYGYFISLGGNQNLFNLTIGKSKNTTPTVQAAKIGDLPEGFLPSLVLNGETQITQSYNVTYPQSLTTKQATVVFESSKTLKENYDFYAKWAQDNGWAITTKDDSSQNLRSLYLEKNKESINIAIVNNAASSKPTITISYVK